MSKKLSLQEIKVCSFRTAKNVEVKGGLAPTILECLTEFAGCWSFHECSLANCP